MLGQGLRVWIPASLTAAASIAPARARACPAVRPSSTVMPSSVVMPTRSRVVPQGGQVPDGTDGQLRGHGEVEVLQAELLLEPGGPDSAGHGRRGPPVELVLSENLEELLMSELPGAGLNEPDLQGVEHPAELQ